MLPPATSAMINNWRKVLILKMNGKNVHRRDQQDNQSEIKPAPEGLLEVLLKQEPGAWHKLHVGPLLWDPWRLHNTHLGGPQGSLFIQDDQLLQGPYVQTAKWSLKDTIWPKQREIPKQGGQVGTHNFLKQKEWVLQSQKKIWPQSRLTLTFTNNHHLVPI